MKGDEHTTWDFEQTRFWTDEHGQEWVCVPTMGDVDVPTQLRRVADQWDSENARG
jgi:glycosyltransferase A (GT-A) superfamily protein (DUF2064 family)